MNITKKHIKRIYVSLAVALCCTLVIGMVRFEKHCNTLRDNCLRLHILANSNSIQDQQLKLKVRDEVLKLSQEIFCDAKTLDQAIDAARQNEQKIINTATDVLRQNGCNYTVRCEIDKEFFSTREYEQFTLPAGNYEAVRLLIGEAKGKNWWCVMFPSVCVGTAAEKSLQNAAGISAANIALGGSKYKMKFKIVEIFQTLKQRNIAKNRNGKE